MNWCEYDTLDYSQHFILFVAHKWAQKARVLHYTKAERLSRDKHFILFSPIVSYDENELLWIWYLRLYYQHFILFLAHKWAQKARVLHYAKAERLDRDKHSCLFSPFVSYKENELLWIWYLRLYYQHFIFFVTYKGPKKLECSITPRQKGLPGTRTLAYSVHLYVTMKMNWYELVWIWLLRLYSQHFFLL